MSLKNKVIRMAYDNPDLRPHLLPLLKQSSGSPVSLYAHIPLNGNFQTIPKVDGRSGPAVLRQILYRLKQERDSRLGISVSSASKFTSNGDLELYVTVRNPGSMDEDDIIYAAEKWLIGSDGAGGILSEIAEEDPYWEYMIYGGVSEYDTGGRHKHTENCVGNSVMDLLYAKRVAHAFRGLKMASPENSEITITCTGDMGDTLVGLLQSIQITTGWGTGTSLFYPVDRRDDDIKWDLSNREELESNGFQTEFFFDGDGSDHILEIKKDGVNVKNTSKTSNSGSLSNPADINTALSMCISLVDMLLSELKKDMVVMAYGYSQLLLNKLHKIPGSQPIISKILSINKTLEGMHQSVPKLRRQLSQISPLLQNRKMGKDKDMSLRNALIRLAYKQPTFREKLLPLLRTASSIPNWDQAVRIAKEAEKIIRGYWPDSTLAVKVQESLGRDEKANILIAFALWQKEDWVNGIINNDPMHQHIWIWGANDPVMTMESGGGVLHGYNGKRLDKVGWRNGKNKTESQILKALDIYFGQKLKSAVAKNHEALEEKRQKWYEFRDNVRR